MISDRRLQELLSPLLIIVEELQVDLLFSVIRRIKATDNVNQDNILAWQLDKLAGLGQVNSWNARLIASGTGKGQKEIESLFTNAGYESTEDDEKILLDAVKKGLLNQVDTTVRGDTNLINILNAAVANAKDVFNLTNTIALESANQAYLNIVNRVFLDVSTGLTSYQSAVRSAVKRLNKTGITGQHYATTRGVIRYSLDAAIRRQMVTGVTQTAGRMSLARNEAYGNNLVEVTSHIGARPDHAVWQGKIYAVNGTEPPFRNLAQVTGYGTVTGLQGANCRHQFYPYVKGLSVKRFNPLPKKENKRIYEESQIQRRLERSIKNRKRLLMLLDDVEDKDGFNVEASRLRISELKLKAFKARTGRTQTSRVSVTGFDRTLRAKVNAANRRNK